MKTHEFVQHDVAREMDIGHDTMERLPWYYQRAIGRAVALITLFIAETHDPAVVLKKLQEADPQAADALDALKRA